MTMTYDPTNGHPAPLAKTGGEPQTAAMQAGAIATIHARYALARANPRSWDQVRIQVLKACARPRFAEAAVYAKPIGRDKIRGPSIRLAEELFRDAGNLSWASEVIYEDAHKRVARVTVIDLETNAVAAADAVVEKTVERLAPGDRVIVAQRTNSAGNTVYIVAATDDELVTKTNAAVSKTRRNLILSLVPTDIVEDAVDASRETMRGASKDVSAARKKLCDSFAGIGVMPRDLEEYLGHSLDAVLPDEGEDLREAYSAIRDGETKWVDVLSQRLDARAPKAGAAAATTGAAAAPAAKKRSTKLAEKIADKTRADAAAAPPPATSEAPAAESPPQPTTPSSPTGAVEAPTPREREPGED